MALDNIEQIKRQFLQQLFDETDGDIAGQVSMYDIGSTLGLERNDASRIAEDLIASDLVEIRTLAGAIGIHPEALSEIRHLIGVDATDSPDDVGLGHEPILGDPAKTVVTELTGEIKSQVGALGLDFDLLSEFMADLKTVDAQIESPRPKTVILRECFLSIAGNLAQTAATDLTKRIRRLLEV